jgi:hypothetical protein
MPLGSRDLPGNRKYKLMYCTQRGADHGNATESHLDTNDRINASRNSIIACGRSRDLGLVVMIQSRVAAGFGTQMRSPVNVLCNILCRIADEENGG